uniref:Uncharacterized protein n=1 Tax=Brassica campestris TaxID=3711 RepID=A0A3P5YEW5_BRACM|nr:unnamed protein product [Brassica rapa]VDC62224.1 unnamed protein product [Brassica rapa]VDC62226.1 unnamed protein product [Brassica rapa]
MDLLRPMLLMQLSMRFHSSSCILERKLETSSAAPHLLFAVFAPLWATRN